MTVAMETIRSLRAVTPQNTIIEAQHVGQRFTAGNGTELTVFDNVELGLKARGVPRAERTKLALDAIDMIGLDGFESAYPKELSGGMRQRVGIARALVLRPDALFMDEPFSALDVLTAENLRQEVLKLWSSEQRSIKSVLMVTHNIEEAVEMADRVVVLGSHLGHLIADVRVDLPRPRDRHSVEFEAMVDRLYAILTGQASPAYATSRGSIAIGIAHERTRHGRICHGRIRPSARQDHRENQGASAAQRHAGRACRSAGCGCRASSRHRLGRFGLGSFEVDDLFPLVDAGTMLRVIVVRDGHVQITEAGDSWHKADILHAKQVFASLAMEHAPLVHNIEHALRKSAEGKLRGELMLDLLRARYSNDEAHQQFAIAVEWGRYGELFDYDADDDLLSLDEANKGE